MSIVAYIGVGLVVLFVGLIVYSYYKMKNVKDVKNSENIKVLNAKNFKIQTRSGLVLVDFWAAWCGPCKMLAPILNEIAEKENDKLTVAKLNVDQFQQVAAQNKIRNLPTLVLFKNGVEVHRIMGFKTKSAIMKEVARFA